MMFFFSLSADSFERVCQASTHWEMPEPLWIYPCPLPRFCLPACKMGLKPAAPAEWVPPARCRVIAHFGVFLQCLQVCCLCHAHRPTRSVAQSQRTCLPLTRPQVSVGILFCGSDRKDAGTLGRKENGQPLWEALLVETWLEKVWGSKLGPVWPSARNPWASQTSLPDTL